MTELKFNKSSTLILLILPLTLFFVSNIFTDARTPYYLLGNFDPTYVYLLNSLNIAQGVGTGYIEHPGTPLHILGACVIRVVFAFQDNSDIVADVFAYPETYLRAINFTLIILNSVVLFFLGKVVFGLYGSIAAAIFFQLTPFCTLVNFDRLSNVTPETLLIFLLTLLLIVALKYVNEKELTQKKILRYSIYFALISGAAVAAKISFFPLILIPLILIAKYYNKLLYLIFTSLSFLLCVIPAIPYYKFFRRWMKSIIVNNQMYGKGENTIIDGEYFMSNIRSIFLGEKLYTVTFLVTLTALIVLLIYSFRNKSTGSAAVKKFSLEIRLLAGIFMTMILQTVIVAKHFAQHYMLPSFMLINIAIFLILIIYAGLFPDFFGRVKLDRILILMSVLIIAVRTPNFAHHYEILWSDRIESRKINTFLEEHYPDKPILSGFHTWTHVNGLEFATVWGGNLIQYYRTFLDHMIPYQLHYDNFEEKIYTLSDTTNSLTENILSSVNELVFVSNKHNSIENVVDELSNVYNFRDVSYSKQYSNGAGDAVYLIELRK